jgi:CheY-like chemotaxis protein
VGRTEQGGAYAESSGRKVSELVSMILTDVEMPEMDGYILTKHIKADPRFAGIPVVMHSSLSSGSNQQLGARSAWMNTFPSSKRSAWPKQSPA